MEAIQQVWVGIGATRKWVPSSLRAELPLGLTTSLSLENVGPGWPDLQNFKRNQKCRFYVEFPNKTFKYFLKTQSRPNKTHPRWLGGPMDYQAANSIFVWETSHLSSGPVRQMTRTEGRWTSCFQFCCLSASLLKGLVRKAVDRG